MSTHKHIDRLCAAAVLLALLIAIVFMNGEALGIQAAASTMGYEDRLFDTSSVHTIDIVMDDWDSFIESCENEEYAACSVVIDGEAYKNVGIRAKGNTSLSNVSSMNSDRYSFKIEFDQYDSTKSYYGLDKLSLNNLIQDNTLMKDYLTYRMMAEFGVAAPLCSYVYITVNGEDWGLYLAVEGVEDAFLQRNYGADYGELYKPDSLSMGGGRGNGRDFSMEDFEEFSSEDMDFSFPTTSTEKRDRGNGSSSRGGGQDFGAISGMPDMGDMSGGLGSMGSSDVKLQYIDDDPDSYSSIFDSAKTDVTDADQTRLIQSLKDLSNSENIESVVDMDQVLRYFVVHNFVVNGDSYTGSMIHNYYLYEEDGQLSMIPWDYNLAFGGFQGGQASSTVNDPIDTPLSVTGSGDRPMIDWIFSSEAYTELYHQYFAEFLNTVDVTAIIDQAAELIAPYVEKDPTKFCTYEEFETGAVTLREFCVLRQESVEGQLNGSIPTTDAGQSADSSALIDASHINISDMGSMSAGGGMAMPGNMGGNISAGGFGGRGDRGEEQSIPSGGIPQNEEQTFPADENSFTPPGGMELPGDMELPENMELPEDMQLPEGFDSQMSGGASGTSSGEFSMQMPGQTNGGSFSGGGFTTTSASGSSSASASLLLPLALSAVCLIFGLFIAVKYRR